MTYEPSAATAKRFAWAVTFCCAFRCLPSIRTAVLRGRQLHVDQVKQRPDLAILRFQMLAVPGQPGLGPARWDSSWHTWRTGTPARSAAALM
jgi:hypothetical protein